MPNAARKFHQPTIQREWRPDAATRGYDEKWRRLSIAYKKKHPFCENCLRTGKHVPAEEVDHMTPFNGPDDPLRLKWRNLRALCHSCHVTKTHRDKRDGRLGCRNF